jgi:hypothetical protein
MKTGKIIIIMVLIAAVFSIVLIAGDKTENEIKTTEINKNNSTLDSTMSTSKVIAYYFHSTRRCVSCKKIEKYSRDAIEKGFEKEIKSGKVEFRQVNTDEKENQHYMKDYQLYTKSLVLSYVENGKETKWKNLDKVWTLLRKKETFVEYVQDELRVFWGDK